MDNLVNDSLSNPFVRIIVGIKNYEGDDNLLKIMARKKAEAELTEKNWNLFGYRRSPKPIEYQRVLSKSQEPVDLIFVPQTDDCNYWKNEGKKHMNPFPKIDPPLFPDKRTAVLKRKEGNWPTELPDHFRIWEGRWYNNETAKSNYYGLVIKDLEIYKHGEWFLNPEGCSLLSNNKTMTMYQRGPLIYRRKKEYLASKELFPVIGKAKLIYPYSVRLYKPEFIS